MTDITKCFGKGCPKRHKCFRFTAPEDRCWQSYFKKTPCKKPTFEAFIPSSEYPAVPKGG